MTDHNGRETLNATNECFLGSLLCNELIIITYKCVGYKFYKVPHQYQQQIGAVEACWAHNPEVRGSKPRSAKYFFLFFFIFDFKIIYVIIDLTYLQKWNQIPFRSLMQFVILHNYECNTYIRIENDVKESTKLGSISQSTKHHFWCSKHQNPF